MFQSTRPWGRERAAYAQHRSLQGFNPRARGGANQFTARCHRRSIDVSIHAPVGARTALWLFTYIRCFNPRARGGANRCRKAVRRHCFNPRARGGANSKRYLHPAVDMLEFQSTRPWGRERCTSDSHTHSQAVSIHAPVGARTPNGSQPRTHGECFNPRARGGANVDIWQFHGRSHVSIHAPVGARTACSDSSVNARTSVSIHAPVGARTSVALRSAGNV